MKFKKFIYLLVMIVIPLCIMQVISISSAEVEPKSIYDDLIKQRIEIWNHIYDDSYTEEMFLDEIKNIEIADLLKEDTEEFRNIKINPIGMEKVKLIGTEEKKTRRIKNGYEIEVLTDWQIEDFECFYEDSILLKIEMLQVKGKWFLSKWEYIL